MECFMAQKCSPFVSVKPCSFFNLARQPLTGQSHAATHLGPNGLRRKESSALSMSDAISPSDIFILITVLFRTHT